MTNRDEDLVIEDLVGVISRMGFATEAEWEVVVAACVYTVSNVTSWEAVSYSGSTAKNVSTFTNFELGKELFAYTEELAEVQDSGWRGVKCSVARSGRFRLEYSYDLDEAIKWVGDFFEGGSSPEELIEVLRPVDL